MKLPENTDTFRQAQIQLKRNTGTQTFHILGSSNIPVGTGAEWFKIEADFAIQEGDIDVAATIGGYAGDYFMDHFYIGPAAAIAPCRQKDVTIDTLTTTTGLFKNIFSEGPLLYPYFCTEFDSPKKAIKGPSQNQNEYL